MRDTSVKETPIYADPEEPQCPDLQQVRKESFVKIESHATPIEGTPEQRYATLHRAIEQGLDSDDVWCELASVSATLGHAQEAKRCTQRICNDARRDKYERTLALGDKLERDDNKSPTMAPAASNAGPMRDKREATYEPGVADHLLDAGQYMLHQQMPWLVLTTMLAFPFIVGIGGFLTAGGSPLLLVAMAAIPGVCVLLVVAAMAHEILRSSSEGESDVPDLPEFGQMIRGAKSFLWDATLVFALFFGLPIGIAIAGAPLTSTVPSVLIGVYFAPLAFALRHVRRDLRSFSPVFLVRAARRCGRGYGLVAVAIVLALVPAALVATLVVDHALWVQIAVTGPLCVLPMLGVSRLLGTWLDSHRKSLGYLLTSQPQAPLRTQSINTPPAPKPSQARSARRPSALEAYQAPAGASTPASSPDDVGPRPLSAVASTAASRPAPRAIEGRRPAPARPPASAPSSPQSNHIHALTGIDGFAGAYVVKGEERRLKGAASRPR
jgi:hypothetical protein